MKKNPANPTLNTSYSNITKVIHWITVAIIVITIPIAFYMSGLPEEQDIKWTLYDFHESLGVTILTLVILRFVWRLTHPVKVVSSSPKFELFAKTIHLAFYLLLFVIPLAGWLMNSSGGYPIPWFGLELPSLMEKNESASAVFNTIHFYLGYLLVLLIFVHIAGAFKVNKNGKRALQRMLFRK